MLGSLSDGAIFLETRHSGSGRSIGLSIQMYMIRNLSRIGRPKNDDLYAGLSIVSLFAGLFNDLISAISSASESNNHSPSHFLPLSQNRDPPVFIRKQTLTLVIHH